MRGLETRKECDEFLGKLYLRLQKHEVLERAFYIDVDARDAGIILMKHNEKFKGRTVRISVAK